METIKKNPSEMNDIPTEMSNLQEINNKVEKAEN